MRPRSSSCRSTAHHRERWLDGSPPRQLTRVVPKEERSGSACNLSGGAILRVLQPAWSPDASRIAFLTDALHVEQLSQVLDVAVATADGGRVTYVHRS